MFGILGWTIIITQRCHRVLQISIKSAYKLLWSVASILSACMYCTHTPMFSICVYLCILQSSWSPDKRFRLDDYIIKVYTTIHHTLLFYIVSFPSNNKLAALNIHVGWKRCSLIKGDIKSSCRYSIIFLKHNIHTLLLHTTLKSFIISL